MKWHLIAILSLLLLLGYCAADGMPMPSVDYTQEVFLPEQKAVIFWDGSQEQLVIESKITVEDIANVAWLIPIESSSKPSVEAADEQIFFELAELFVPTPKDQGLENFGLSTAGVGRGVEVIEQLKVDIYDITILRATDADALIEWLNSNGYAFPEKFPNLLSSYVQQGSFYFVANKINLQNKYPGVQPTVQDFECAQEMEDLVSDPYWQQSSAEIEERIKDMLGYRTSPACPAGVNADAVAVLVLLRLGIATPLKITFTPSKPFYPMLLSSLNVGSGDAKLYFVSSKPYKDESGLFAVKNMLQTSSSSLSGYGINQWDIITLLSWQNNYSTLGKDSFFSETAFVPELDPNYVLPWETAGNVLLTVLLVILLLGLPVLMYFSVPFVLGILIGWILEKRFKKGSFFAEGNGLVGLIVTILIAIAWPAVFILIFIIPNLGYLFEVDPTGQITPILFGTALVSLPYYASMACGFFFRKSKYKKVWLLGPVICFILLILVLAIIGLV